MEQMEYVYLLPIVLFATVGGHELYMKASGCMGVFRLAVTGVIEGEGEELVEIKVEQKHCTGWRVTLHAYNLDHEPWKGKGF